MVTEQVKTQQVFQTAIQMEIDGKEYYQQMSQRSTNQLGRELFQSLAAEEDIHRQKFEELYEVIRSKKAWPKTDFQPDRGKRLRTLFSKAVQETGSNLEATATEIDAVKVAMDMENKTFDFYDSQSQNATHDAEREFYESLAAEERGHHLILIDYYEYIKNPASWFVSKEHPSLDGG